MNIDLHEEEKKDNNSEIKKPNPRSPLQALQPLDIPVPLPHRHAKNKLVVFANFLVSCMVLLCVILGAVFFYAKLKFESPGPLVSAKTIIIPNGHSLEKIAQDLELKGIVSNALLFKLGVRFLGMQLEMKAGEYAFKPGMAMRQVMETIRLGKGVIYKITIPEGFTSEQVVNRLNNNNILTGSIEEIPGEGSLMPDTYPFQRGTTRQEIINQMMDHQKDFIDELWKRKISDLPIKTKEELVILASIVEKETAKIDERPHIASVFLNRLKKGMKLQSDPTIIYGLFRGKGKPKDRPIYQSDIDKYTPYNTYIIKALPPGPIANPGRAALEAVVNPSITDYLFFVADGTGGHAFAKTLKEHVVNKIRWRKIKKQQKEKK